MIYKMIDWYIICTRCKIEKHVWAGNNGGLIHSTIPSEFCEKHFKKGCSFKDLHFCGDYSSFLEVIYKENYTEDKDKYDMEWTQFFIDDVDDMERS